MCRANMENKARNEMQPKAEYSRALDRVAAQREARLVVHIEIYDDDEQLRYHTVDRAALEALSPLLAYPAVQGRGHPVLDLTDESYDTFKLLNHFILKGHLPQAPADDIDGIRHYEEHLISGWCFGRRYRAPKLQNAAMHGLLGLLRSQVDLIFYTQYTVRHVSIQSALGGLLLEKLVFASRKVGLEVEIQGWECHNSLPSSRDFLEALGRAFAEHERAPLKWDGEVEDEVRADCVVQE
ncbi:hypothetical protein DOTSEDRAFT_37697 [Dothistroma septosporum NZE10]|uniref:BTB domain-containing protein n=1 Tax=Dothistroma septosporum (strain NZE10 / CBS 128990) TaxID=675120 RepID=N1PEC5_DOTSN|nr:hypothetical protein DOTSEDRAFT_37697 [Dothistroma septosporum NZE10]